MTELADKGLMIMDEGCKWGCARVGFSTPDSYLLKRVCKTKRVEMVLKLIMWILFSLPRGYKVVPEEGQEQELPAGVSLDAYQAACNKPPRMDSERRAEERDNVEIRGGLKDKKFKAFRQKLRDAGHLRDAGITVRDSKGAEFKIEFKEATDGQLRIKDLFGAKKPKSSSGGSPAAKSIAAKSPAAGKEKVFVDREQGFQDWQKKTGAAKGSGKGGKGGKGTAKKPKTKRSAIQLKGSPSNPAPGPTPHGKKPRARLSFSPTSPKASSSSAQPPK